MALEQTQHDPEDLAATAQAIRDLTAGESTSEDQEAATDLLTQAAEEQSDSDEDAVEAASKDDDPEETTEEPTPAKGRSQKLQKLIDSKGGDEDKFAESIYEQMNSASRQHEELEALRTRLAQSDDLAEPEVDESSDDDPDVRSLQQDLEDLNYLRAQADRSQASVMTQISSVAAEIYKLQGKLEVVSDEYKPMLVGQISSLEARRSALESEWMRLENDKPRYATGVRRTERQLREAQRRLANAQASRQQMARETVQKSRSFRVAFDAAVDMIGRELGIPEGTLGFLAEHCRLAGSAFLRSLPETSNGLLDPEDMKSFVRSTVKKYAAAQGITSKAKFKEQSKQKLAALGSKAPTNAEKAAKVERTAAALPKPTKTQEKDAAYWKNRAATLLP